jgi:hypothetical protein
MGRALRTALLVCALAFGLAAPAGATVSTPAITYGLGDAPGAFAHCVDDRFPCCEDPASVCLAGSVGGYYDQPAFQALTTPASRHRIGQVRFFVDYDAVQEFNGSTTSPGCEYSRALLHGWYDPAGRWHPPGQSLNDLVASLIEAGNDRLTAMVAIAGYENPSAKPPWDQTAPDPTTPAGYWEYRCGVQGILDAVSRLPPGDQPHIWEAFNEPDAAAMFNGPGRIGPGACDVRPAGEVGVDGAAKAACEYAIADDEIRHFAGHGSDTVIAGTFGQPSVPYLAAYAAQLRSTLPEAEFPATWSVHDYRDVTASFGAALLSGLEAFDEALRADTGGGARALWITEAGVELTDPATFGGCAPAPGLPETLGACVDGRSARQAVAAANFFALPEAGVAVPITHLFWYQWQGVPDWDSGILDPAGKPRAPWCAFFGSGVCDGSPDAA